MDNLFFELIQVAIGTRDKLSRVPIANEWRKLFETSKKQELTAVAFRGVTRLKSNSGSDGDFESMGIDEITYLKWLGLTAKIAQRNKVASRACVSLCKQYAHDGLNCCVLKGQGNLEYYPEELQECRTPGDIDVWCSPKDCIAIAVSDNGGNGAHYESYKGIEGIVEYVNMLWCANSKAEQEPRYLHIDAPSVDGVDVEVHLRPSFLNSPIKNARLQKWFWKNEQWLIKDFQGIPVPTVGFNVIFQLTHINKHLMDEGIGLRQLLDYYMVLRVYHNDLAELGSHSQSMGQWAESMGMHIPSVVEMQHLLERFGMKRFAGAVMWVLQEVFAMPDEYLISPTDKKEGEFLLSEIMMAGNFGKYDERLQAVDAEGGSTKYQVMRAWRRFKRNMHFLKSYPEEVIWEPFTRYYHFAWRKLSLWKY